MKLYNLRRETRSENRLERCQTWFYNVQIGVFSILYRFKTYFVLIQNKLNFELIENNKISVTFLCLQAKLLLLRL